MGRFQTAESYQNGVFTVTKKQSSKTLRLLLSSVPWLVLVLGPGMASAVMLSFEPPGQNVELGQQATVDIYVRDLAGSRIGAFDFNVEYDSSVLSVDSVAFGSGLGASLGSFQDVQIPSAGQVNIAELAFVFDLSPFQDGVSDFLLFSLTFDTVAAGMSSLGFSENILGMAGGYLADEIGLPVGPVNAGSGYVTVVPGPVALPEPASILLLAAGLAGLMRRKSSFNLNPRIQV